MLCTELQFKDERKADYGVGSCINLQLAQAVGVISMAVAGVITRPWTGHTG